MTAEAFRLTPHDVRAQKFGRVFRGLDPMEVDDFLRRAADEFERALREQAQLEERVKGLGEQLGMYRERERAMNEALVAAQQLREESRTAAERARDQVLREAQQEADRVVERAAAEAAAMRDRMAAVERQFVTYVAGFRALLQRQLAEVAGLESATHGGE